MDVCLPDIGDFSDVPVVEILVKPGDVLAKGDAIVVLESDKATLDIPSPVAGIVERVVVTIGDVVHQGSLLISVTAQTVADPVVITAPAAGVSSSVGVVAEPTHTPTPPKKADVLPYASPTVRKMARENNVDLGHVSATGRQGRVLPEDVKSYLHQQDVAIPHSQSPALSSSPLSNFSKLGETQRVVRSRIQKISAQKLHHNWTAIPHVTTCDDADITDLENFRQELNQEARGDAVSVTLLTFLIKAVCAALKQYPILNASLDGDELIVKKYYNIGVVVETPSGLLVPVIHHADQLGILEMAKKLAGLVELARAGQLSPRDMQGGGFSISSLGGIGGTYFTPIIHGAEVAILGVCRAKWSPVFTNGTFVPRLLLPLSLSYDHRVVDGALAARFNRCLMALLADMRKVLL